LRCVVFRSNNTAQTNNNTHDSTAVALTPIVSNSQILVNTLPKKDQIVEAKSINQADFPLDSSGTSSVRIGIVCAFTQTGIKNNTKATKKSVQTNFPVVSNHRCNNGSSRKKVIDP
jgi:hypothetical protein